MYFRKTTKGTSKETSYNYDVKAYHLNTIFIFIVLTKWSQLWICISWWNGNKVLSNNSKIKYSAEVLVLYMADPGLIP